MRWLDQLERSSRDRWTVAVCFALDFFLASPHVDSMAIRCGSCQHRFLLFENIIQYDLVALGLDFRQLGSQSSLGQ